ncbi:MAG: Cytochrome c oxidase polypeptide I, partial [uncultured Solirubrobacterales bacterium]
DDGREVQGAGLVASAPLHADRRGPQHRARRRHPRADRQAGHLQRQRDHHRRPVDRAVRLPDRHRLLRLLVPLGVGRADGPRGPLRPRCGLVARLLPRQHRSQGDRHPVHLHHLRLLHPRRADGDADPDGA